MAQQLHKNTFEKGLVSDFDEAIQPEGTYRDAYNVRIDKDGSNFVISAIAGTEELVSIDDNIGSTANYSYYGEVANIIGTVSAQTYFDNTIADGIWVFIARKLNDSGLWRYNIFAIDTKTNTSYKVFENDYNEDYSQAELDFSIFGEGGVNYIYATDGVGELKRIKCVVSTASPLLSEREISLIPLYPSDELTVSSVSQTGGALITGSYQFSYRFIRKEKLRSGSDASRNIYSKWTIPTDPVLIHKIDTTNNALAFNTFGGLGQETSKAINLFIQSISSEELSFYNHIEIAVMENISGSTIPTSVAKRLYPIELADNAFAFSYKYLGSEEGLEIPVSEIVIDSAYIDSAKTLAIKNNRLLAGNINYKPLNYDRGDVEIGNSTTPITTAVERDDNPSFNPAAVNENEWIKKRGYFRDETYRFAISYFDENGSFSSPQTIDFSAVSSNNAGFGSVDFRFPERSEIGFGILDSNNDPASLGLRLSNITNHPTWARGFVILRARRKKKIKFQSPLVPTTVVEPQVAFGNYPTIAIDNDGQTVNMTEAQPPSNPNGTIVPKNFRYGHARSIQRSLTDGDMEWSYKTGIPFTTYMVFPPEDLYQTGGNVVSPYRFSGNDAIKSVDAALLDLEDSGGAPGPIASGDGVNTEVTSVYKASTRNEYYYGDGPATSIPSLIPGFDYTSSPRRIKQYIDVENQQSEAIISGQLLNFGDYDGLNATNGELLPEGFPATNQKCKVLVLNDRWYDVSRYSYAAASRSSIIGSSGEVSFNGQQLNMFAGEDFNDVNERNDYVPEGQYCSAVEIVNVEAPIGDDRYGDATSQNEFYFTGAYKRLSNSEVENNTPITIDVYGGDCFIGYHTFKLTDTTYSITRDEGVLGGAKWQVGFSDGGAGVVERAVPVKAHNQYLRLYLESEVEPQFGDERFFSEDIINSLGITRQLLSSSVVREIYPTYGYNLSYSVQNNLKVFFSESNLSQDRDKFGSRIIYSDQKIYQSDLEGFDTFPVGNTYDQDESNGEITKIINKDGNVYSIQERAVSYIPTDSRLIETTDTTILSIRSDEFIGLPDYLTTFNGCSDILTVKELRDGFIFLDRNTKDLIKVAGTQVASIADDKIKDQIEDWIEQTSKNDVFKYTAARNIESGEYYLFGNSSSGSFGVVFSNEYGIFSSKILVEDSLNPISCLYNTDEIYVISADPSGSISLNKMNSSTSGYSFLGGENESSIEFVVNPNVELPKMFNNTNLFSRGIMGTVTTTSNHVSGSSVITLDDSDLIEGTYRIKTLRGDNNRRLRGQYAKNNITWPIPYNNSDLIHVITKYDISRKPI